MFCVDKICKALIYGGLLYWIMGLLLPLFFVQETLDSFYFSIQHMFRTEKVQSV